MTDNSPAYARFWVTRECERVLAPLVAPERREDLRLAVQAVLDGYEEPHRVYHSTQHLMAAFTALRRWEGQMTRFHHATAFVALLLHDYIYNIPTEEKSNETLSGEAAEWFLPDSGLDEYGIRLVDIKQAISATEGYPVHNLIDMVVVWCDIWGLSRSRSVVMANSEKIRQEFMNVFTAEEFAVGRQKFLDSFHSPFRLFPGASLGLRIQAAWLNFRANRNLNHERRVFKESK